MEVDLSTVGALTLAKQSRLEQVKMLVRVRYGQQQKYVKLEEDEGRFDFLQFHEKVIERFCLPTDAKVAYKDATGTEVDEEIFSDLVGQGNVVLTVFSDQEFSDSSLYSASGLSDSSFSSSTSTVEVYSKRQRIEDTRDAASAKQLIEAVLRGKSGGEEVLQEYQTTETLTDAARRQMVNILVAHMIDNHGHLPTKETREDYAHGIVMLFPSLRDPYSKKGYVMNTSMILQAAQDTFLGV
ncbi:unnamed protein product [Gadus morhua 'NCC']